MAKRITFIFALVFSCVCLLISCKSEINNPSDIKTDEKQSYKIEFKVNDRTIAQQLVDNEDTPNFPEIAIPGVQFVGWIDNSETIINPEEAVVTADATYYAKVYPLLDQHNPFLFLDKNNFIYPNKELSCNDLSTALQSLASSEAKLYFPTLPTGDNAVTPQQLRSVLTAFFNKETVENAINQNVTSITREQFAVIMCKLLERGENENIRVNTKDAIPVDISTKTDSFIFLLEASVPHIVDENGNGWRESKITSNLSCGFVNYDGWLYYIQDNGYILTDGYVGKLYFDKDGRYTCGDAELDVIVADILKQIIEENPDADRFTLLREAFEYSTYSFTYLRKDPYLMGATGWEIEDAKKMFQDTRGNCYYFAGAFWSLAQGLGYEAEAVSGTCTGTHQPHAWVIIEFDGEDYFFDPQWQNNYHTREMDDMDMFMIPMDKIWYWTYEWIK